MKPQSFYKLFMINDMRRWVGLGRRDGPIPVLESMVRSNWNFFLLRRRTSEHVRTCPVVLAEHINALERCLVLRRGKEDRKGMNNNGNVNC